MEDPRRTGCGQTDQPQGGAGSTSLTGRRAKEHESQGENCARPPDDPLILLCSSDDSKSSSPEPVTHLKWDDPYYDIARHQIVEVAGEHTQPCTFSLTVCIPGLRKPGPPALGEGAAGEGPL